MHFCKLMLSKFKALVKGNVMFFMGMVFGSVIGTVTTVMITMGYLGVNETVMIYQSNICNGSSE